MFMRQNQVWIHHRSDALKQHRSDALKQDTKERDRIGVAFLLRELNAWPQDGLKQNTKERDRTGVAFLFQISHKEIK
jgi:hypothetical protein